MDKSEFNKDFKFRVSRSLSDLQKSLDEACRIGLPPVAVDGRQRHSRILADSNDFRFRNDLTYKSAVHNLERFLSSQELRDRHEQQQPYGTMTDLPADPSRLAFLNTLRLLAAQRQIVAKSQSYEDVSGRVQKHPVRNQRASNSTSAVRSDVVPVNRIRQLEDDIDRLQQALSSVTGQLRAKHEAASVAVDGQSIDELRRKLDSSRTRERELLRQMETMLETMEESKEEEMRAVIAANQTRDELEAVRARISTVVTDCKRTADADRQVLEQSLHAALSQVQQEMAVVKEEARNHAAQTISLQEQLRSADAELDRLNGALRATQTDAIQTQTAMETFVARAAAQRDEAESQVVRLRLAFDRERGELEAERVALQDECAALRSRLAQAEQGQASAADESMRQLQEAATCRKELMVFKQSADEQLRQTNDAYNRRVAALDAKLMQANNELTQRHIRYEKAIEEADMVMRRQQQVIGKLKHELGQNIHGVDAFAERHREQTDEWQWRNGQLQDELSASRQQITDLQATVNDYSATVDNLRMRCDELETKRRRQDEEVIELLATKNRLLKGVEMLTMQLQEVRRRFNDCSCGVVDVGDKLINELLLGGLFDSSSVGGRVK